VKHFIFTAVILTLVMSLPACESKQSSQAPQTPVKTDTGPIQYTLNKDEIARGEKIYRDNCSGCHGDKAQGDPNWRKRGQDGKFPPPPLNGTGHAWHHPTEVLIEVIKQGTVPKGNMPSWEGKLSDQDIRAVIAWFQSQWPDEVMEVWQDIDRRNREQ
jgi:mono/diheme cytochrome c family protein